MNYLLKNFKESMEVANAIKTLRDPLDILEKLNEPEMGSKQLEKGSVEEMILKKEVKD